MDAKGLKRAIEQYLESNHYDVGSKRSGIRVTLNEGFGPWDVRVYSGEWDIAEKDKRVIRSIARRLGALMQVDDRGDLYFTEMDMWERKGSAYDDATADQHPIRTGGALSQTDWSRYSRGRGTRHVSALRRNPRIAENTPIAELQQKVARVLHDYGAVNKDVRFRETSRGGLQVTGLDSGTYTTDAEYVVRVVAEKSNWKYEEGGDSFILWPRRLKPREDTSGGWKAMLARKRSLRTNPSVKDTAVTVGLVVVLLGGIAMLPPRR